MAAALKVSDRVVVVSTTTYAGQVGVIVGLDTLDATGDEPMAWVALDECTGDRHLPVRELRPARAVPPIAASDIWSQVIEAADGRCQCPAKHHRSHRGGRCYAGNHPAPLVTGPAVLGPNPDRMAGAPQVAELIAWCPGCWDETVRDARRQDRAAQRIARRDDAVAGLW